jgi:hypothetical protein
MDNLLRKRRRSRSSTPKLAGTLESCRTTELRELCAGLIEPHFVNQSLNTRICRKEIDVPPSRHNQSIPKSPG